MPQVEPRASFWFRCPLSRTVSYEDVQRVEEAQGIELPPYPHCDSVAAMEDFDDPEQRARDRQNPPSWSRA